MPGPLVLWHSVAQAVTRYQKRCNLYSRDAVSATECIESTKRNTGLAMKPRQEDGNNWNEVLPFDRGRNLGWQPTSRPVFRIVVGEFCGFMLVAWRTKPKDRCLIHPMCTRFQHCCRWQQMLAPDAFARSSANVTGQDGQLLRPSVGAEPQETRAQPGVAAFDRLAAGGWQSFPSASSVASAQSSQSSQSSQAAATLVLLVPVQAYAAARIAV